MVQQGHIDHLLQESGEIHPPRNLVEQANLQDYDGVYQRSINDPEGFWGEVASELEWFSPWDKVMQWDYPDFKSIVREGIGEMPGQDEDNVLDEQIVLIYEFVLSMSQSSQRR